MMIRFTNYAPDPAQLDTPHVVLIVFLIALAVYMGFLWVLAVMNSFVAMRHSRHQAMRRKEG